MQDKKKGINIENTSWSFTLDPVHLYAFWNEAFTKEECDTIVKIAQNKGLMEGATTGDDPTKSRNSHISWLNPSDNLQWFYERLTGIAVQLNDDYFKFDLYGINEGLQFTNYKAPSGKYGKHVDKGVNTPVRKLSISVQLTNPDELIIDKIDEIRSYKLFKFIPILENGKCIGILDNSRLLLSI